VLSDSFSDLTVFLEDKVKKPSDKSGDLSTTHAVEIEIVVETEEGWSRLFPFPTKTGLLKGPLLLSPNSLVFSLILLGDTTQIVDHTVLFHSPPQPHI